MLQATAGTIIELIRKSHRKTRCAFIYLSRVKITCIRSAVCVMLVTHPKWRKRCLQAEAAARCSSDALTSPNLWQHFLEWCLLWEITTVVLNRDSGHINEWRTAHNTSLSPTSKHVAAAAFDRCQINKKEWRWRLRSGRTRWKYSRTADSTDLSRCGS